MTEDTQENQPATEEMEEQLHSSERYRGRDDHTVFVGNKPFNRV